MSETAPRGSRSQTTDTVMMIRPVRFQSNAQTAADNSFQDLAAAPPPEVAQAAASTEFSSLVAALERAGIRVLVFDDTPEPHTPDSVFPNNWLSTHEDGTVIIYPMMAPNRRHERRLDLIDALVEDHGLGVDRLVDLSGYEQEDQFLEGTGSLVLDRTCRTAYACSSARTAPGLLDRFGQITGYRIVAFDAVDPGGTEIYHTNVLMCIGSAFAVVCLEAIRDDRQRETVERSLAEAERTVIPISHEQMGQFAGNMLELSSADGDSVIAMSRRAHSSLSATQRDTLQRFGRFVVADIDTIEDCAGGSVRCMIAELHLPVRRGH
jgi:hypothetical protein